MASTIPNYLKAIFVGLIIVAVFLLISVIVLLVREYFRPDESCVSTSNSVEANSINGLVSLSVVNHSSLVQSSEFEKVLKSIQKQISNDFSPHWDVNAKVTGFKPTDKVNPKSWIFRIYDTKEQIEQTKDITTSEKVNVQLNLSDLTDKNKWSVVLSHEILESLIDPLNTNNVLLPDNSNTANAINLALLVCDPVGATTYSIDGVEVSNFVLPSWFKMDSKKQYDFLQAIDSPLSVLPGGCAMVYTVPNTGEGWQIYCEENHSLQSKIPLQFSRSSNTVAKTPCSSLNEKCSRLRNIKKLDQGSYL